MKPNLVIVMADQLRADMRRGCGYPLDTMPFLDQWARGGVDFRCACTSNPTCMPARVSMLTGRYCQSHRVRTNFNARDVLYTQDLLDVMRAQGYTTALVGKNHTHRREEDFDFASPYGHVGHTGERNDTLPQQALADFLCALKSRESMTPAPGSVKEQHPYRCVEDALRFMDGLKADQPFFAWISFPEPHPPYQVPEPYFDMFPADSLPRPVAGAETLPGKGERYEWTHRTWQRIMGDEEEARLARARSNYLGMLRLIDDQLRRLVEGMDQRGLSERTLVLFLADHGDFAGEYGLTRKGPELSQALTRIPMIWRGPGVAATGAEENACVNMVDVLPTVCELLGVEAPVGCQGRSLLPLLRGDRVPPHEFDMTYAESGYGGLFWTDEDELALHEEGATGNYTTFDTLNTWTQCGQVRMVRKGHCTLQLDMMGNGYLYDLQEDPMEVNNLYHSPAHMALRCEMLEALGVAMLRAADPLPLPRARYRLKRHPRGWWTEPVTVKKAGKVVD